MKIAVLARPESWHFQDLKRAAGDLHELHAADYTQLATLISNNEDCIRSGQHELANFDCVLVRAMPAGSLSQVVFRMDLLQQLMRLGVNVINSPKAIEASVDKYLSLALLKDAEIPVPRTGVCQSVDEATSLFGELGGDVVAKPLFGSMGNGLTRITNLKEALIYFEAKVANDEVIYLQQFINHGGRDIRLLVIGQSVLAMQRHNDHWITNVSCGGIPSIHNANEREKEIAIKAAKAVNGRVIGVDLVYDQHSNRAYVVEVNSSPGWRALSGTLEVDVAVKILDYVAGLPKRTDECASKFNRTRSCNEN